MLLLIHGCLSAASCALAMEYYARYMHEHSWHQGRLKEVHATHHRPRRGGWEANDVLGCLNALVVAPVMYWSSQDLDTLRGAIIFASASGVSAYGVMYMLVHDGVHHGRFYTGGLGSVPLIRDISRAHSMHHRVEQGPPFGLFLGPQELDGTAEPMPQALKILLLYLACIAVIT